MSRTLVLRGEPGMGKTALISYAASATDLTRLSVAGVEAESNFAFAGLHRLVSPLLHDARNLPQSQRTALEVAFGLATGPRPDQYLFALAVLTLLAGEAGDHGLLCLVDDAQWLDMESVSALGIVARRLHADGIAILVGLRIPAIGPVASTISTTWRWGTFATRTPRRCWPTGSAAP